MKTSMHDRRVSESRLRFVRRIALVTGALMVIFLPVGIALAVADYRASYVPAGWETVDGIVVEVDRETRTSTRYIRPGVVMSGDAYTVCAPILEVEIGGTVHETVPPYVTYDADHCAVARGDTLGVAFDPTRPETVRLAEGGNASTAIVMIGLECVLLLVGVYVLGIALTAPTRLLKKGRVVVPDDEFGDDPVLRRVMRLLVFAGLVFAIAFIGFGIEGLREPDWITERATLTSDALPSRGTRDCGPVGPVQLASGRTVSLMSGEPELCGAEAGDTIDVHHRGDEWGATWVRYGVAPEESGLPPLSFVVVGMLLGAASLTGAWSFFRAWRRQREAA